MNRTIKEATVKRFHYDTHDQLTSHLADFVLAYNFARRLKTLEGLTPYEAICKTWTNEPERSTLDPIHQMPGLNSFATAYRPMLRSLGLLSNGSVANMPAMSAQVAPSSRREMK